MKMKKSNLVLPVTALALFPSLASAHVGDHGLVDSFAHGFLHPILGFDHLLVLLAMGVLAYTAPTRKQSLLLAGGVILSMFAGAVAGALFGVIGGMEALILGSAFVAAVAILKAYQTRSATGTVLVSISIGLVLFHGWAHGAELHDIGMMQFIPGMLVSSAMLVGIGYRLAQYLPQKVLAAMVASSGVLLVVAG